MPKKCPVCNSVSINEPTNIEKVSLFFIEKGKQDIDIGQNISTILKICNDCGYIMLFKK